MLMAFMTWLSHGSEAWASISERETGAVSAMVPNIAGCQRLLGAICGSVCGGLDHANVPCFRSSASKILITSGFVTTKLHLDSNPPDSDESHIQPQILYMVLCSLLQACVQRFAFTKSFSDALVCGVITW